MSLWVASLRKALGTTRFLSLVVDLLFLVHVTGFFLTRSYMGSKIVISCLLITKCYLQAVSLINFKFCVYVCGVYVCESTHVSYLTWRVLQFSN